VLVDVSMNRSLSVIVVVLCDVYLVLELLGEHNLVDHLGQVLARRLPPVGHTRTVLPRARLELVTHHVELK